MCSLGILRLRSIYGQLCSSYKFNKYFLKQNAKVQCTSMLRKSNISEMSKMDSMNSKSNLEKDKLLFMYENPKFFYLLNGFAFVQFFFWLHMSEFTYRKMKDVKIDNNNEALPWWRKLNFQNENTRKMVAAFCFMLGYGILSTAWIYTLRSVRMLVLRKGGRTVTFVTYGPLGRNRHLDVSLEKITTSQSRVSAKVQLPIKIQGKWFYYILDTKGGTFPNPELFDFTAGMKRKLK
uniref:Transmembrane protein 223 n=1 Tax=Graphocephala atropunctata TaxID=36148 RepID=A0A1B6LX19_9HEMI